METATQLDKKKNDRYRMLFTTTLDAICSSSFFDTNSQLCGGDFCRNLESQHGQSYRHVALVMNQVQLSVKSFLNEYESLLYETATGSTIVSTNKQIYRSVRHQCCFSFSDSNNLTVSRAFSFRSRTNIGEPYNRRQ